MLRTFHYCISCPNIQSYKYNQIVNRSLPIQNNPNQESVESCRTKLKTHRPCVIWFETQLDKVSLRGLSFT